MAPEQFSGVVSKESDQYALACIAYELFTGRRPFEGNDIVSLNIAHARQIPVPLRQFNASLPIHIEQTILKALSKQRADRYRSIDEFITALYTQVSSPPPSPEDNATSFFCYPLFLASGLSVLLFKENQSQHVRFHAWQSILFSAALCLVSLFCLLFTKAAIPEAITSASGKGRFIPLGPWLIAAISTDAILSFVALIGWIILMYRTAKGSFYQLPLLGIVARRISYRKRTYNLQSLTTIPGTNTLTSLVENDKFMATMSYSFFFITGLITFFLGKNNRFIRFHALQSIFFFCIIMFTFFITIFFLFQHPPTIVTILAIIIGSILFTFLVAGWGLGMYHAFKGHYYKMPFVGGFVENIVRQDSSLV